MMLKSSFASYFSIQKQVLYYLCVDAAGRSSNYVLKYADRDDTWMLVVSRC